jgi:hypothetical protein
MQTHDTTRTFIIDLPEASVEIHLKGHVRGHEPVWQVDVHTDVYSYEDMAIGLQELQDGLLDFGIDLDWRDVETIQKKSWDWLVGDERR